MASAVNSVPTDHLAASSLGEVVTVPLAVNLDLSPAGKHPTSLLAQVNLILSAIDGQSPEACQHDTVLS